MLADSKLDLDLELSADVLAWCSGLDLDALADPNSTEIHWQTYIGRLEKERRRCIEFELDVGKSLCPRASRTTLTCAIAEQSLHSTSNSNSKPNPNSNSNSNSNSHLHSTRNNGDTLADSTRSDEGALDLNLNSVGRSLCPRVSRTTLTCAIAAE